MAQVFVSWSEERSRLIANGLKSWLPDVFQGLKVWMSDHDIQPGMRWGLELSTELEEARLGVICLTPENRGSDWLLFEAGALSKSIKDSRVIPYRFGLRDTDVGPPLSQFQGVDADRAGTLRLAESLNMALEQPLDADQLNRQFERCWADMQQILESVPATDEEASRSDREVLEEILTSVRQPGVRELRAALQQVLALPSVTKIEVAPKSVGGTDIDSIALSVVVNEKRPLAEIPPGEVIPHEVYGLVTDVVERSSKD